MIYGMMMPDDFETLDIPFPKKVSWMIQHILDSSKENNFDIKNLKIFKNDRGIGWICGDEKEVQERLKTENAYGF